MAVAVSLKEASREIRTPRLLLRALCAHDTAGMYAVYSDPETMKYWSDSPVPGLGEAESMIHADLALASKGAAIFWAVVLADTNEVIGKFTLMNHSVQNRRAEVGFILNRQFWGQGLMTEALTGVIEFAFNELGLHRLEADTDINNAGSLAVMEKLGFQREGLFRDRWHVHDQWQDSMMLGLLQPDWFNRGSS